MALDMDRLTRPNKEKQVSLSKSGSGLPSIRGSRLVENGHHNTGSTNHMRKADSTLSFGDSEIRSGKSHHLTSSVGRYHVPVSYKERVRVRRERG
jgi:hypothetical protein